MITSVIADIQEKKGKGAENRNPKGAWGAAVDVWCSCHMHSSSTATAPDGADEGAAQLLSFVSL